MKRKIILIPILITIIATVTMSIIVIQKVNKKKIETIFPSYLDITKTITFDGNIYPKEEIEVKSFISGIVDEIYVDIGDNVIPDQKIAKVKIVPDPSDIESAESSLRLANISLIREEEHFKRGSVLYQKKVLTQSEFEDIVRSYNIIVEQQNLAQMRLNRLLNTPKENTNGHQNIVKATTSGTIIDIPIEKGSSVINRSSYGAGTTIATMVNLSSKKEMVFKARIAERDLYYVRDKQPILIIIKASKADTISAFITKIYPKGYFDQGITKYNIEVSLNLEKLNTKVYYGYSATAVLVAEKRNHVLAVNQRYIQFNKDTTFVQILNDNNEIIKRVVKTGISDDIYIEILSGISSTDKLVLSDNMVDQ